MSEAPRIDADAFKRLIAEQMGVGSAFRFEIEELARGRAVVRLEHDETFVRPGGTISGPTLFTLADLTLYAAVLSEVGNVPLAVTTDMSIHFLQRPPPGALRARGVLLKSGSKLVCGQIEIEDRAGALCCHAVGTYAVPSGRARGRTEEP